MSQTSSVRNPKDPGDCWGKRFQDLKAELATTKKLVREMVRILKPALTLTLSAADWSLKYGIAPLNDEALAVNGLFFINDDEGILNHPEVKKIMEEKT